MEESIGETCPACGCQLGESPYKRGKYFIVANRALQVVIVNVVAARLRLKKK